MKNARRLSLLALVTASFFAWNQSAAADGVKPSVKAYNAFDADEPADEIAPDGTSTVAPALAAAPSLPMSLGWEGATALPTRQIPANAPGGKGTKRTFRVGDCELELTTGHLSVSTHQLVADGRYYVTADSLLRGTTVRAEENSKIFLSISTDLTPRIVGEQAARLACVKRLKRGPVHMGSATLEGTRLAAVSSTGKAAVFAKAAEATTHDLHLVWDRTLGGPALRDADGMIVLVESAVFSARTDGTGYFDLDVLAEFKIGQGKTPSGAAH